MPLMADYLCQAYPALCKHLAKVTLADLPTRTEEYRVVIDNRHYPVIVKHDEETSSVYGGNKIRKLEYLLGRAEERRAKRVATFGAIASNHALATALHATRLGFDCTCLLSHQRKTINAALALNMHLECGTEIVRYGGERRQRVATMRKYLQGRDVCLTPMGGSNWLGVVGFVNAGLELAAQVTVGAIPLPDRLYVANGTMATAAGLALGLAAAGLKTEVHAVRVTHDYVANPAAMRRLITKAVTLMNRLDATVPLDLVERTRIRFRDEFFGDGYAHPTPAGEHALGLAADQLGITLDTTYTGKAMAALLHDRQRPEHADLSMLFWNTYCSIPSPVTANMPHDTSQLPQEFLRYFD